MGRGSAFEESCRSEGWDFNTWVICIENGALWQMWLIAANVVHGYLSLRHASFYQIVTLWDHIWQSYDLFPFGAKMAHCNKSGALRQLRCVDTCRLSIPPPNCTQIGPYLTMFWTLEYFAYKNFRRGEAQLITCAT